MSSCHPGNAVIRSRYSQAEGEVMASSSYGQVMSDLLTIREKGLLMSLMEPQCKAKDAEGESLGWRRLHCGVVCLIENESVHSYFLRLYCVTRAKLLWEQELYVPLKYTASRAYFHTFPAEAHQVGINFANETEAEEFHLAVKTVHEKMAAMINVAKKEEVSRPSSISPNSIKEPDDSFYEEPISFTAPLTKGLFFDLDPAMSSLLMQAKLSEEDLKNKEVPEVVDCIIKQFGGVKAVQRELKKNVSKTLPRAAGTSISVTLKKGPLPPLPPIQSGAECNQASQETAATNASQFDPSSPGRIRRSASYRDVSSTAAAGVTERGDLILAALREVFKQKKLLQQSTCEGQDEPDTN